MQGQTEPKIIVIGAGPAGLMAAETLARAGYQVDIYDAMPTPGRKFLRAGVGGLNLTHAEEFSLFCRRYAPEQLPAPWLRELTPLDVRQWAAELGIDTFVGSSGRVFPVQKKAAPLLRQWLKKLESLGVRIHVRHRWTGMSRETHNPASTSHHFLTANGPVSDQADCTILALGGGSWAKLGSDGSWLPLLRQEGVDCNPFRPANCGFETEWSEYFMQRFAGTPVKAIRLTLQADEFPFFGKGELMISQYGIEGGLVYQASSMIRNQLERQGSAELFLDMLPEKSLEQVKVALLMSRGKQSLSNYLRKRLRISGVKLALLHELAGTDNKVSTLNAEQLATLIKALPLRLTSCRPVDEAISTVGGVAESALDSSLMLKCLPGIFCAGEMLDWDAPTGGYLLTACFASGQFAGKSAIAYLQGRTG
ncbi:MAG: TIGR03862 family flavoprotein [Pseudomonadales bacterium]|nr:TIGR03862 family flavoprotein [Pseudomonadales bacterium]